MRSQKFSPIAEIGRDSTHAKNEMSDEERRRRTDIKIRFSSAKQQRNETVVRSGHYDDHRLEENVLPEVSPAVCRHYNNYVHMVQACNDSNHNFSVTRVTFSIESTCTSVIVHDLTRDFLY